MNLLEIQKNSRERIRVEVCEFKGKTYVDLRVWFVGPNGDFTRSGRGVMLQPSHIPQIIQGLMLAARAAGSLGTR